MTSKAGLAAAVPSGAVATPASDTTSSVPRSSMAMPAPSGVAASTVDSGATTMNGTPAWRAPSASENVPILLAVSPLAATRSAPVSTTSASPLASMNGPAESTSRRWGAPIRSSSQAVRRAPCSRGLVSRASASASRPRSCRVWITARAVPRSTAASPPVLQMVMALMSGRPTNSSTRSAPRLPMATEAASSSSRMAAASASTASRPSGARAAVRSTMRARFTAVGRASRSRVTASSKAGPLAPWACTASATPKAPATPMAGAPRTDSRRMAATMSATLSMRSTV